MSREKVLLGGVQGSSKSMNLIQLAILYPDRKIVIFDPDDGIDKVLEEVGFEDYTKFSPETNVPNRDSLPALSIIPITPDWLLLVKQYRMIKSVLVEGDWLCFDMLNRFWDFAQNFYSTTVLGQTMSEHLLALREQAKAINFGGFDGLTDWVTIKRLHNQDLLDDALLWSKFNVMATTSINTYLPVEKVPKAGIEGLLASAFGVKLEGEKHNPYRFDTIAILSKKPDNHFYFRLAKDKGRPFIHTQEFDITGSSFWAKYCEFRGREL